MIPEWVMQIVGLAVGAASVYAGIRADLAAIRVRAELAAGRAEDAHQRIDNFFKRG